MWVSASRSSRLTERPETSVSLGLASKLRSKQHTNLMLLEPRAEGAEQGVTAGLLSAHLDEMGAAVGGDAREQLCLLREGWDTVRVLVQQDAGLRRRRGGGVLHGGRSYIRTARAGLEEEGEREGGCKVLGEARMKQARTGMRRAAVFRLVWGARCFTSRRCTCPDLRASDTS